MRSALLFLFALPGTVLAQEADARVLTLDAALTRARENSPVLRGARASSEAADARQDKARASFLPQLTGTASYARQTGNFVPRPGALPTSATSTSSRAPTWDLFNYYQLGLTASILVYDFNGSIDRFRSAKETRLATEQRERASALSVDFSVRDAFFQARAQRALIGVARETLANNERHVEQVEAFVQVGTRPEIDLMQVRTERANAKVSLVQAENAYAIAKVNLQRAMGVEESVDFEVADERLEPLPDESAQLDALLKLALEARPDVLALTRDLRATNLTASASKGTFGPTVTASTSATEAGVETKDLHWNWAAGVQLNWPIIRGGATIAEVREAKANVRRTEASIAELRQTVRLQVEQARLGLSAAAAVLEAAGEALANAKARLQLAEGRYEAGVGNVIELGDAQVALTQAEAQSVSAEYSLSLARAQLLSALGRSR